MGSEEVFRTPDDRFDGLPEFDYQPSYRDWNGLRLAHLDLGEGKPVLFLHGEPTWSFLWRKVFPQVVDAGYRAIVPDLAGFGRSDKPVDLAWYSYDRHVASVQALIEELDLTDLTVVVHDWGGPIGLRVVTENQDRVSRVVVLNTGLFNGRQRMSEAWLKFRSFVESTEDLPIGMLVNGGCKMDLSESVVAAYEAPFPEPEAKAGARAFPLLVPLSESDPAGVACQKVIDDLKQFDVPSLSIWGADDPIITAQTGRAFTAAVGLSKPRELSGASHFLQEDRGEDIGQLIAEWLEVEV